MNKISQKNSQTEPATCTTLFPVISKTTNAGTKLFAVYCPTLLWNDGANRNFIIKVISIDDNQVTELEFNNQRLEQIFSEFDDVQMSDHTVLYNYADDTVLLSDSIEELQQLLHRVNQTSEEYGLNLNVNKTKYMVISKNPVQSVILSRLHVERGLGSLTGDKT